MNFEQMVYLIEVFRTSSVTKAAENLFVSQSTISKSLGNLQKSLGVELFKATKSGVVFTEIGTQIVRRSKGFLFDYDRFKIDIDDLVKNDLTQFQGNIVIAAPPVSQDLVLPYIVPPVMEICPNISFITELVYFEDVAEVLQKRADILVTAITEDRLNRIAPSSEFVRQQLCDCEICIAMRKDHPLHEKPIISVWNLLRYPWITLSSRENDFSLLATHCGISTDTQPKIVLKTSILTQAFEAICSTDCVVVTSNFSRAHYKLRKGDIKLSPIKEAPPCSMMAIYRKDSPKRELLEFFIRHINLN